MYLTKRNNYDLFDEMFRNPFFGSPVTSDNRLMRSDVTENDNAYVIDMELPGFEKENIKAELNDGYLTISAARNDENEVKDKNGKCIRKERFSGSCKRSFYVGDAVKEEDIKAAYRNGILTVNVPKLTEQQPEQPKLITID